jgi:hypothetical protein
MRGKLKGPKEERQREKGKKEVVGHPAKGEKTEGKFYVYLDLHRPCLSHLSCYGCSVF